MVRVTCSNINLQYLVICGPHESENYRQKKLLIMLSKHYSVGERTEKALEALKRSQALDAIQNGWYLGKIYLHSAHDKGSVSLI